MSKLAKSAIIAAVLCSSATFSSVGAAACVRANLTGTWWIYTKIQNVAGRCAIIMPAAGTAIATTSYCHFLVGNTKVPISGNLWLPAVNSCQVVGTVVAGGGKFKVDAWLSRDANDLTGMTWPAATPGIFDGTPLTGVKQ